jgi:hypothetical protein
MNAAVTVKHLDLADNNLAGEEVGEAICQLLGSCVSVESLRLSGNPLQDAAIVCIAEGVKTNCVLQVGGLLGPTAFAASYLSIVYTYLLPPYQIPTACGITHI